MGEVGCRLLERQIQILELELKNENIYVFDYDYVSYFKL